MSKDQKESSDRKIEPARGQEHGDASLDKAPDRHIVRNASGRDIENCEEKRSNKWEGSFTGSGQKAPALKPGMTLEEAQRAHDALNANRFAIDFGDGAFETSDSRTNRNKHLAHDGRDKLLPFSTDMGLVSRTESSEATASSSSVAGTHGAVSPDMVSSPDLREAVSGTDAPYAVEESLANRQMGDLLAYKKRAPDMVTDSSSKPGSSEWKLKTDFSIVVPDYKSLPAPWSPVLTPTRLLQVKIGPEDNTALERHYREHLAGRSEHQLSDSAREKLHTLALVDVVIDKYQQALSNQEIKDSKSMPEQIRGVYLAAQALEDGAVLGACRSVVTKVFNDGALEQLATGAGAALAVGNMVTRLAASVNPWVRGAAVAVQSGGIALAIKDIGDIGHECFTGFVNSCPALEQLIAAPSEKNHAHAKETLEKELGPPLADGVMMALGFSVAHGIDKSIGRQKPGRLKETERSKSKVSDRKRDAEEPFFTGSTKGPPWKAYDIEVSSDVVKQIHKDSCVSAVGEMLSGGKINQESLMAVLGTEKVDFRALAQILGSEWRAKYIDDPLPELELLLAKFLPFGATLKKYGYPAHMVVVDGLSHQGKLIVRDPAEGFKYQMDREELLELFQGVVWKTKTGVDVK